MEYHEEVVIDFARRTRANLEVIEKSANQGESVYEVTQLANSLLGLLVFPREHYMRSIPNTPLPELVNQGWPEVHTTHGQLPQNTLQQLMRMLRNSVAHCNVEFIVADDRQITGIKVWNTKGREKTWESELTIKDLRTIAIKFVELIEQNQRQD